MSKTPKNQGKAWNPSQVAQLETLAGQNTPTRTIARLLGRTEESVFQKAAQLGISIARCRRIVR
jgi:hypothetical protein